MDISKGFINRVLKMGYSSDNVISNNKLFQAKLTNSFILHYDRDGLTNILHKMITKEDDRHAQRLGD